MFRLVPLHKKYLSSLFIISSIYVTSISSAISYAQEGSATVMVGLGDSITAGFNAGGWGTHRENSWVAGTSTDVNSQFSRLSEVHTGEIQSHNYSKVGAQAHELSPQIERLIEKNPDIVHLLIGANDVCSWRVDHAEQLSKFELNISKSLDSIIEANSEIKIVLVSIPDLNNLYSVGKEKGCSGRWNTFKICQPLLGRSRTDLDRQKFGERLDDANNTLRQVALERSQNVFFSETVKEVAFSPEDVSKRDCFHPSIEGQALLSKIVWEDDWYNSFQ